MAKIKNADELLRNAGSIPDRKARKLAIDALNAALGAVDSKAIVKRKITLKNNTMKIGNLTLNLSDFQNTYVVGGGKASGAMAEALADILSERIKEGIVNVPYASLSYKTGTVKLQPASHLYQTSQASKARNAC